MAASASGCRMSALLLTQPQAPELFAGSLRELLPGVAVWESAHEATPEAVEAILAWRLAPGTAARYPNLRLICWSRTARDVPGIAMTFGDDGLADCPARANVLVCTLPLTARTRHILNGRTLGILPDGAYVINVARGGH